MKTVILAIALLSSSACIIEAAAPAYVHADDGLFLKLCDRAGNCEDPGQLVLLNNGDGPNHPLHWSDLSMSEAMENDGLYRDLIAAWAGDNPSINRTFEVACDHIGPDTFACARTEEDVSGFDDGLFLKLCNSSGCEDPGQLMLLTAGNEDHSPFHMSTLSSSAVSDWSKMRSFKSTYVPGAFTVGCVRAVEGIHVFACALQ